MNKKLPYKFKFSTKIESLQNLLKKIDLIENKNLILENNFPENFFCKLKTAKF